MLHTYVHFRARPPFSLTAPRNCPAIALILIIRPAGLVDSSGFRIKVSKTLRQYDAGVMELGLEYTDKMAIPPGQTAFPLSGYCVADCTRAALPRTGIIIFGSQLHTHLRGVRILTRHFRGEQELREVNRDDYYSHHFQEIRTLHYKPRVLPVSMRYAKFA